MLRNFGSVAAIELDSFARDHVRAAMKIEVAPGSLPDDLPYADRKFDLICLFDVLEHVERDQQALCNLRERLAPNGLLVITVPAYQWLYSSHDAAPPLSTLHGAPASDPREGSRATARPRRLLQHRTVPACVNQAFSRKLLNLHPIDDSVLPGSLLNQFLYRGFSLEARLIGSWFFPFGLSVLGMFRRQRGDQGKRIAAWASVHQVYRIFCRSWQVNSAIGGLIMPLSSTDCCLRYAGNALPWLRLLRHPVQPKMKSAPAGGSAVNSVHDGVTAEGMYRLGRYYEGQAQA